MIGIDLFCGAGGMSLGAERAGVEVLSAVDLNRHATDTYKNNHPNVDVKTCDIRELSGDSFQIPKLRQTVVFGGPPCQGFSTSNQRTRSRENPANWLFSEYMRLVKAIRPDWVIFENVKGILETDGGYFFRTVVRRLTVAGYTVSHFILNAADFGVPQKRWRLFVIGSRHGQSVAKPEPTSSNHVSVKDAIWDLPILRNGASLDRRPYRTGTISAYARGLRGDLRECGSHLVTRNNPSILERYTHIPGGGNWADIPRILMSNYVDPERCHTGIYKRLSLNEPSVVIGNFRKNMLIHPTQKRGLSVREAARIQSFPDSFEFSGSIGFQQQQVGNAVPPLLAKAVFDLIVLQSSPTNASLPGDRL